MTVATPYQSIPKKVWIGTYEFVIQILPRNDKHLDEGSTLGLTEFDPYIISLADGMNLPLLLETVYHEITHAVNWVGDIEDGVLEETISDKHGKVWSQFWIENPRFQRWWTAQCVLVRKERARG